MHAWAGMHDYKQQIYIPTAVLLLLLYAYSDVDTFKSIPISDIPGTPEYSGLV